MRNLKDFVSDWIRDKETDECRGDMVNCGNELVMVRLEGDGGLLNYGLPDGRHDHAALFIMRGELHLTLNGNRIGLLAPAYIDFVLPNRWENIELKGEVEVYLMAAETGFFHEVTSKLRTRISERMMAFAQSPFILFSSEDAVRMESLVSALFSSMTERIDVFRRELVQSLMCAFLCELWNVVFRQCRSVLQPAELYKWGDSGGHFLHLAHVHCREHHEVKWYCEQLGISANTLTAVTKHLYGKTARMIIDELLLEETKLALRNPDYSIQSVSDQLFFSDQSAFGKFFKRCYGISPALYRRQIFQGEIK